MKKQYLEIEVAKNLVKPFTASIVIDIILKGLLTDSAYNHIGAAYKDEEAENYQKYIIVVNEADTFEKIRYKFTNCRYQPIIDDTYQLHGNVSLFAEA